MSSGIEYNVIMLSQKIKNKALELGFLSAGIIPSGTFDEYTRHLDDLIKSFPESEGLYQALYDMARQKESAKSIIVCTKRYNKYKVPDKLDGLIGKYYLFDCRVPYSQEYREIKEFESFLNLLGINILQGRVPDRLAAAKAGLGKFGRNNFLYDPKHGSYIYINAWVVDKELEYDPIENDLLSPECKESCRKCVQSCPTKALSNSFFMDRGKCITHLTCFVKNTPDEKIQSQMGRWLYGCDVCQDVCPLNKGKFTETEEYPLLADFEVYLKPEQIKEMDEETYKKIINPRFWYAGEENLWLWKSNAHRSIKNSGEKKPAEERK